MAALQILGGKREMGDDPGPALQTHYTSTSHVPLNIQTVYIIIYVSTSWLDAKEIDNQECNRTRCEIAF